MGLPEIQLSFSAVGQDSEAYLKGDLVGTL